MNTITITQIFDVSIEKVWQALSDEAALKSWYFPVQAYTFEEGTEFTFYESCDSSEYFHRCRFLKIVPMKCIEYTWTHPNHSKGSSVVAWSLHSEGEKTRVTLTHTGVEHFADAGDAFSVANFTEGWKAIVGTMLRNYLYGIKKLKFSIEINAPSSDVWRCMWSQETYTLWMKPFCEGTYYEGDLKQGSRVHFLAPSGEGMYSDIAVCNENELMIFNHIGMIKDKKEIPPDAEIEKWTGCDEVYRLQETAGKTLVNVEVDSIKTYIDFIQTSFPLALAALKQLVEHPSSVK